MKDHLIFDTTDATSIADSDSVGAHIRAGDDGTLIGHVSDALKVNFSNTTIDVTATDLDIRDLAFATDSVDVSGSSVSITGDVNVTQGTSPWVVSATDLDIRDLTQTDEVTVFQGTSPWVVSATDLDIRDLDYTQDNVAIKGSTGNQLVVEADGSINVNADISITTGSDKAEDSAHASGDIGTYILGVRQDTLATDTSADGDYASLKVDALGALYVNVAAFDATVTVDQGTSPWVVSDAALAATAIANAAVVLGTADTAEDIIASPLASRKYVWIYNNDNTKIFIGASGVTAANGFPVSPGSYLELRAGAAVDIEFVGQAGKTPAIRTLELS